MFHDQFPATRGAIRRLDEIRAEQSAKAAEATEATAGDNSPPSRAPAAADPFAGTGMEVRLRVDSVGAGTLHISIAIHLHDGSAPAVRVPQNKVAQ